MLFSAACRYILLIKPKYLPQHDFVEHPQLTPYYLSLTFISTREKGKIIFLYVSTIMFEIVHGQTNDSETINVFNLLLIS